IGAGVVAAGLAFTPGIVHLFGASAAVTPHAVTYLRISLLGVPAMFVVLAATGVLRGFQDTRTPLVVAAVRAVADRAANAVLVCPVGLGIAGSAAGTAAVQNAMAAAYLTIVLRRARSTGAALRPDWRGVRASATAGVPLIVRTVAMRATLVAAAAIATRL